MSHQPAALHRIAPPPARSSCCGRCGRCARRGVWSRAAAIGAMVVFMACAGAVPPPVMAADAPPSEATSANASTAAAEPSIRPKLKPDLKSDFKAEARTEGKAVRGEVMSETKPEPKAEPKTPPKPADKVEPKAEAKSDSRAPLSMSELRDVLDQKIAEVRAKQGPAPVVKVQSRGGKSGRGGQGSEGAALAPSPLGPWSYHGETGPEHWARLKPEFSLCSKGQRQSPIDIRDGIPVELDPIAFDYRPTAFRVIDNGHTVQVNLAAGNRITVNGRRYELTQFHFHRPSEERLNGKQFDMVMHLEHRDIEGKLAVLAILINEGKGHPLVQQVWNNLPLEKFTEQHGLATIDLSQILPEQRQYVTYMGSQTTPPCQEGVLWMVMKQAATASAEQMAIFARLYPMNARPVQPTAGRLIKDGQ